ncbi:MAG: thiamine pyrophosphate-dependent enzyme [Candidatus Dormibacteraceae bacterium]
MQLTGGQAMARQLVAEGVGVVFGLPGVQLDWAVDGLASDGQGIRFIATRHEQGTTYMADGYSRASGRPGVAMVVPGPGVLNAMAGLATAYACNSRVLLIAAQVPGPFIGEGRGVLHEIPDQTAILRTLTKWTGRATRPEEVTGLLREAFRQLSSGRPRPVAVELPPDVLQRVGECEVVQPAAPEPPLAPDTVLVERAAKLLAEARFPVVVAGGGVIVADAAQAVTALAERLGAPILKSSFGHSAVPDSHPLVAPTPQSGAVLARADVILAIGTRFLTRAGGSIPVPEGTKRIALNIDDEDTIGARTYDLALIGDAELGARDLEDMLRRLGAPGIGDLGRQVAQEAKVAAASDLESLEPQMSYVRALRAGLPDGATIVNDLTQVGFVAELGYEVRDRHSFVTAGYQGTLGYGFPTALGFKVGAPERDVVALVGDGGFGYALQELSTAKGEHIGVTVVLFADGWYGNVRRTQKEDFDGRFLGTTLANPDFVELAHAFGVAATQVDDPAQVTRLLEERRGATEPALIVVPQGEVPSPWAQILWSGHPQPAEAR